MIKVVMQVRTHPLKYPSLFVPASEAEFVSVCKEAFVNSFFENPSSFYVDHPIHQVHFVMLDDHQQDPTKHRNHGVVIPFKK